MSADAKSFWLEEVEEQLPSKQNFFKSSLESKAIRRLSEASLKRICGFTSLTREMIQAAAGLSSMDDEDEIGSLMLELDSFAKVQLLVLLLRS